MRIALATCADLPSWESDDDALRAAFATLGATPVDVPWDADADWGSFDGCLIRTTWDYVSRHDAFLAWSHRCARATTLANPADIVVWNSEKSYLFELRNAGLPVVPGLLLQRGTSVDIARLVGERGWSRAFIKPMLGSTSRETLRFRCDDEGIAAADAHVRRLIAEESLLLQPYLQSVETHGEISLIMIGGRLTHAVRKIPRAGDYRVQDDFGARDFPHEPTEPELRIAGRTMRALPAGWLYARIDLLLDDAGQPLINEVEMVEPSLFFRHSPAAAMTLAEASVRFFAADRRGGDAGFEPRG